MEVKQEHATNIKKEIKTEVKQEHATNIKKKSSWRWNKSMARKADLLEFFQTNA